MRKHIFFSCLLFLLGRIAFSQNVNHWETVVFAEDYWFYHVGTTSPSENWKDVSFDNEGWLQGTGGFGYADGDDNTVIASTISVYIRKLFSIVDTSNIDSVLLHMDYDDGFVAYLNGVEIARNGVSGNPPAYNQLASIDHEAAMYKGNLPECYVIDKELLKTTWVNGFNVLAVQVHNRTTSSSDLSSIAYLSFGLKDDSNYYREVPDWFFGPIKELETSNLPIVLINTEDGLSIPNEPKVKANMKIIDNGTLNCISDSGNIYDGNIGIEIRGHYSAGLPQKPYGLETRDDLEENRNVPFWDMPSENDWILLANYNDKTFMRNTLSYHLFRSMGHYAARTRLCEVMINNAYQGIYVFTEKIKQDDNRVDIAKLADVDISGDELSGGYIFKVDYSEGTDKWYSKTNSYDPNRNVYFVYHDPKVDDMQPEQKEYIQSYVDTYEAVLFGDNFADQTAGYRSFINVPSFVDYFIIGELSRNVDAYKKSKYYFKDKDSKGGLLNSGPVWDFDWAWKDLKQIGVQDGSGWVYTKKDASPNPDKWIIRLMEDPLFANQVHDRYFALRETLISDDYLNNYIDSIHALVDEAQVRHYKKWDILGINVGAPELGDQPSNYAGEISKFKNWIDLRLQWLDAEIAKFYTPGLSLDVNESRTSIEAALRIFPNPANDFVFVENSEVIESIGIYNPMGQLVSELKGQGQYAVRIDVSQLHSNIYLLVLKTASNKLIKGKLIKQ